MREFIDIIKKSLTESLTNVDIFGIDIPVIVSPSADQIRDMLTKCERVRGIEHGDVLYVWDGYSAVHFQIEAGLGLSRRECSEFLLSTYDGKIVAWYHANQKQLLACPAYQRIAGKLGIDLRKTSYLDEGLSGQKYIGYKVMAYDPEKRVAVSLANKKFIIELKEGKVVKMPGKGLYLSNDRQFVMDYYSDLTDGDEVLITFSFSERDIIEGDPEAPQSEITVKKATVKSFEIL